MKHLSYRKISLIMAMFLFLLCCTEDNEPHSQWTVQEKQEIQAFFNVGRQSRSTDFLTALVNLVIESLNNQENLLTAIRNYKAKYGVPLWEYGVGITVDGGYQLFVPVYNDSHEDEILSIWHFLISSDKIRQYTLTRTPEHTLIVEYWKYDFFTSYALGKTPKSGLIFRNAVHSRANAITYECQTAYIGVEYDGEYMEWPVETLCWEVESGGTPLPDSGDDGDFPPEIPVENGSGDGLGGGGGSSGSGSSGSSSGSNVAPMAQAIFRNSNMTDANWQVIERMLEKIVDDCMGANLYNALKEELNGNTLTIQFTDSINPSFHFDGEVSGIKLSIKSIESNHLLHEMFHAYQAYQETVESYVNAILNLEIEAHYAQYLYLRKLPEYPGSKWSRNYANEDKHRLIALLDLNVASNGYLTLDGSETELEAWLNDLRSAFKADSAYYKFEYNETRKGLSNFQNIKVLTKNCDI